MHRLDQLFAHLDRWRHLPAYQLERRADIFFSLYLAEVLEKVTGVAVDPRLVPELPIKRNLVRAGATGLQSFKVDYAAFARDRSKVVLVELKADGESRRDAQDQALRRAREVGLPAILEGVIEIAGASSAHRKYAHLLQALADVGCLALRADLMDRPEITVEPGEFEVVIVYIQPEVGDARVVSFETFAQVVGGHDDPVSQRFAEHLLRWRAGAGSERPTPNRSDAPSPRNH